MSCEEDRDKLEHPAAKDLISSGLMLPATSDFDELIRLMHAYKVSACIVVDQNFNGENEYYIITRSDIIAFLYNLRMHEKVRESAREKSTRDEMKRQNFFKVHLSNLMNGPVEILDEDTSIDLIIQYMSEKGFKRVLVGKDGNPSGIVNIEEILAWNSSYFKKSTPIILFVMDNKTSLILGKYLFPDEKTHQEKSIKKELIELYGGVLTSLSSITEEIFNHSGNMRVIRKDNYTILFEPSNKITSVLVADHNSIFLRRKLHFFNAEFLRKYSHLLNNDDYDKMPKSEVDISELAKKFQV